MTLPTLRDRGLLQPGARLLVLSRVDLTCGIALPQCLQRLVAPRTHLAREQAAHCPDHQQDNRYPEEDHQAHAYEPATTIHSKTIHHIRMLLSEYGPQANHSFLSSLQGSRSVYHFRLPLRLIRV